MVRQLACSSALVLLAACATSNEPLPPGDELEHPEAPRTVVDPRGNARIPDDRQPTQDELLEAFDAPEPATAKAKLSGSGTVSQQQVTDPLAGRREAFAAKEAEVKTLVATKDAGAPSAAEALEDLARALGPPLTTRALKLRFEAARATGDDKNAQGFAWKWLLSCGPEAPDRCRREAYSAISRTAAKAPNPARAKAMLKDAKTADACLRGVESASRKRGMKTVPSCADDALRTFRRHGDALQASRLYAARGRIKGNDEAALRDAERDLGRAGSECTEARCSEVRQKALERLAYLHLRQNEAEAAARAALKGVQVRAASLPVDLRPWAWTDAAQRACAAYDAQAGQGACRKLERSVVGFHSYLDYSRDRTTSSGLTMDQVREVNAHYGISLQSCLAEEASRLRPPAQERYTVRWVVLNDGRVGEMHMERKDRQDGPLAQCFRQKLAVWRYPRYDGEFQHVEQTFAVSANRR